MMFISIKSAASQCFDAKKYDGNMKAPDNKTPTFGYSRQVDVLKISVSGLCSTDDHVPHSGAICAVQLAPSYREPKIRSHALGRGVLAPPNIRGELEELEEFKGEK